MNELMDNFSSQAATYASYRPTYPDKLYQFLFDHVSSFEAAWDCGTGNGQVAHILAGRFEKVYATDISNKQLEQASKKDNIIYKQERAETTDFPSDSFDLITVATAVHWFDFDSFYKEVTRTGKNNAVVALWAYSLLKIDAGLDKIVDDFYIYLNEYWDIERKLVDNEYQTIPFPLKEIATPPFLINVSWPFDHLVGYLNSWSAVQHYIQREHKDPVEAIVPLLRKQWGTDIVKEIQFPVFMRAGRIEK